MDSARGGSLFFFVSVIVQRQGLAVLGQIGAKVLQLQFIYVAEVLRTQFTDGDRCPWAKCGGPVTPQFQFLDKVVGTPAVAQRQPLMVQMQVQFSDMDADEPVVVQHKVRSCSARL